MEENARIVTLIDMDCFYVQVEERDNPDIKGFPAAVAQYNKWKGGGIIAVNYEARAKGVTRSMRGDQARGLCPEIAIVNVPENNGKANLDKYRDAGKEVVDVILTFPDCIVERASIDEVYVDLSDAVKKLCASRGVDPAFDTIGCLDKLDMDYLQQCFPIGQESMESWIEVLKESDLVSSNDVRLAVGAEIVGKMRKAVLEQTGFKCSAGIAHNKVLAKLGGGLNKPNKQTVIPQSSVQELYSQVKIGKVRNLGGQVGDILVHRFNVEKMNELLPFSLKEFASVLGNDKAQWVYNLVRGIDHEPVCKRELPQSIGCSKNFVGPEMLNTKEACKGWLERLACEVVDRLWKDNVLNNRKAQSYTLHVTFNKKKPISRVIGHNFPCDPKKISSVAATLLEKLMKEFKSSQVVNLGLIASKFVERTSDTKITTLFKPQQKATTKPESAASTSSVNNTIVKSSTSTNPSSGQSTSVNPINPVTVAATDTCGIQTRTTHPALRPTNIIRESEDSDLEIDIETCTPDSVPAPVPIPEAVRKRKVSEEHLLVSTRVDQKPPSPLAVDVNQATEQHSVQAEPPPSRPPIFVHSRSPVKKLKLDKRQEADIMKMFPGFQPSSDRSPEPDPVHLKQVVNQAQILDNNRPSTSKAATVQVNKNNNVIKLPKAPEPKPGPSRAVTREPKGSHFKVCYVCDADVGFWEYEFHMDEHMAEELHKELNGLNSVFPIKFSSPVKPKEDKKTIGKGKSKTKSGGRGGKVKTPTKQSNTLDAYFKK